MLLPIPLRWLTLTQLYHTKLEQLIALTARLVLMSRVVGDTFFPEDVLDQSVGRSPGYQDVSLERFSKLEKELVRGKGEIVSYVQFLAPRFTY